MNEAATKSDIQAVREDIDEVLGVLNTFVEHVDKRFNVIESRLEEIDTKFGKLLSTVDGFVARIDRYETERIARDNQFEKLLVWARKVSEKTGIPLENL